MEVLPRLVPGTVFKTVEPHGNHVVGGFDSHAFPPFEFGSELILSPFLWVARGIVDPGLIFLESATVIHSTL